MSTRRPQLFWRRWGSRCHQLGKIYSGGNTDYIRTIDIVARPHCAAIDQIE